MKVIVSYYEPPIPIRNFDWLAYFDGREEGPCGYGKTKMEALDDLLWQTDTYEEEVAVQQHMDAVEKAQ